MFGCECFEKIHFSFIFLYFFLLLFRWLQSSVAIISTISQFMVLIKSIYTFTFRQINIFTITDNNNKKWTYRAIPSTNAECILSYVSLFIENKKMLFDSIFIFCIFRSQINCCDFYFEIHLFILNYRCVCKCVLLAHFSLCICAVHPYQTLNLSSSSSL